MRLFALLLLAGAASACTEVYSRFDLSSNFNETVAHAIHSMTVQGLRLFNPRANEDNKVPTVNHNVMAEQKVVPYAPSDPSGNDFATSAMNLVDHVLSNVGAANDGLGPRWSPVERLAHNFHMMDLWHRIKQVHDKMVEQKAEELHADELCACLLDTKSNGIYQAVSWVAHHYSVGTPITLLNRPIPKLTDAKTWSVWKDRLLHYYTPSALRDAAIYMHCTTKDF